MMIKCRKVCYATKRAAKHVVKRLKSKGKKYRLRIYLCEDCQCWHTTGYDAKAVAKMKDNRMNKDDDNSYDHKNKQIACDSRTSAGGCIVSDSAIKYKEVDGVMWFLCGKTGESSLFIDNFKPLTNVPDNLDVYGLRVEGGIVYLCTGNEVFRECGMVCSTSIGSGEDYALSAIDFGMTAKEAIEYTITRDMNTGGKVHVYDIEKGVFI